MLPAPSPQRCQATHSWSGISSSYSTTSLQPKVGAPKDGTRKWHMCHPSPFRIFQIDWERIENSDLGLDEFLSGTWETSMSFCHSLLWTLRPLGTWLRNVTWSLEAMSIWIFASLSARIFYQFFKKKTSLEWTRPGFIKNGDVLIREIIQPFGIFQFSSEQSLWESTMSWQNMFDPQLRSYHLNVVQPGKNHPPLSTPDPFSHQFEIGLDRKVIHAPRVGFLGWKKSFLWNQIKI